MTAPDETRLASAEALLRRLTDLAAITHAYGSMGGHDRLGEGLSCAGCALTAEAKTFLGAGAR